jgi:predicted dienelactone hydrolase
MKVSKNCNPAIATDDAPNPFVEQVLVFLYWCKILGLLSLTLIACSSCSDNLPTLADSSSNNLAKPMLTDFNYKPILGPYSVQVIEDLDLQKTSGQQLPLKIYYPEGEGKFPIIIFSHGTGGSKDGYSGLGSFWSSYGYICIHPTHADSLSLRGESIGGGNLQRIIETILKDPESWQERVQDISLIIDSLAQLERQVPQLAGKMDDRRIGVGGHSYGAYTAQLMGGATIDIPGGAKGQSFADPRVKSILLLSPQGTGQQGLTSSSWQGMKLPMMVMTGSNDRGAKGQGPEWKMEPFELAPPNDKYLVFIQNANHFSFEGRLAREEGVDAPSRNLYSSHSPSSRNRRAGLRVLEQKAIFDYVKLASLAFWDAYLKGELDSQDYLKSQRLQSDSQGAVSISVK